MPLEYVTMREVTNKQGEVKGKIKIMKMKGEPDALVELTCPNCGNTERKKEPWREPFVTGEKANQKFTVKCDCGFAAKILKLKKEIKKKK